MNGPQTASYDTVAIQNIDTEDFVFEYDRSRGNYPYVIPAGEVKRFPRFLAEHAVKHLIDKILNRKDILTNNTVQRQALAEQIVVSEEVLQQAPQKTETEVLQERIDKLNKPSELESVLDKHRKEEKIATTPPVKETKPEETIEKFEGLEETKPEPKPEPEPKEEVKPMPTRKEIYSYATNKLGMTINKPTMKQFDKLKVSELLKELGDPREDLGA